MGIIITKFRKKKTTYEVLEKLENEIQSIEEFRRSTEQTQKRIIGRFIFISICVYFITALILYFYFFPASAYERIIYIIPLIILPMLLILLKRILSWYYNQKIRKNQKKLSSLKDEKKKILEDVMNKETYKVAKSILERFAPEQVKKPTISSNESTPSINKSGPLATFSPVTQNNAGLRYRGQFSSTASQLNFGSFLTPKPSRQPFVASATPALFPKPNSQSQSSVTNMGPLAVSGTPLPLPRAILPRDRTVLDKMVDYLVGDGPSNRYALICKNCSSHNGMALKEEFDYLSFRCCYCLAFNPARKKRPLAPKLDSPLAIKGKRSDMSESDRNSPSDSDSESETNEPIITEPHSDSPEPGNLTGDKPTNLSETDKLLDFEVKNSDTESLAAMEVDTISPLVPENVSQQTDNNIVDNNLQEKD